MRRTLEMTVIEGIKTTIPLHLKILADPDFQAGRLSTSFMDRFQSPSPEGRSPARSRVTLSPALRGPRRRCRRRARLDVLRSRRAPCSTAARRCSSCARKPRSFAVDCSTAADAIVAMAGARRRTSHRQRSRGCGAHWPARPVCTSARTICRRRARGDRRRRTRWSGCPRTRRADRSRRSPSRSTTSPSGPVFGTATKDTGYEAVGHELIRYAAARASRDRRPTAGRCHRRHHAGTRAGGHRRRARRAWP